MRTRKTVVILISGKAEAGKTTVGDRLVENLKKWEDITVFDYGFADPLKYIAKAFFGWNGLKDEKGRKLLQDIGRIGREYDEVLWVKHFLNQLDKKAGMFPFNFAVIDDWRFPNEVAYLKDNPLFEIITIRVFGRGGLDGEVALDISENSLPETIIEDLTNSVEHTWSDGNKASEIYSYIINNDVDLEVLNHKLDIILADIEKKYIVKENQ